LPDFLRICVEYASQQIQPGAQNLQPGPPFFISTAQMSMKLLSELQGGHIHGLGLFLEGQLDKCLGAVLVSF
jgi:hypothetical protein